MLDAGVITADNLCCGIRGSVRRKPSQLKAAFDVISAAIDDVLQQEMHEFHAWKAARGDYLDLDDCDDLNINDDIDIKDGDDYDGVGRDGGNDDGKQGR